MGAREKVGLLTLHFGHVGSRIIFLFATLYPMLLELALHGVSQATDTSEPEGNFLFCL